MNSAKPVSLLQWASVAVPQSVDLIIEAGALNKRLGFRVDAWVAANALCDVNGVTDLEQRGEMISDLAKALVDAYG